jgi:serine phosphatase RsbU (regulator of sigma subunit)
MARRPSDLALRGARPRRALRRAPRVIALAGCALLLCNTAATAKTDHVKSSTDASAPSATTTTTTAGTAAAPATTATGAAGATGEPTNSAQARHHAKAEGGDATASPSGGSSTPKAHAKQAPTSSGVGSDAHPAVRPGSPAANGKEAGGHHLQQGAGADGRGHETTRQSGQGSGARPTVVGKPAPAAQPGAQATIEADAKGRHGKGPEPKHKGEPPSKTGKPGKPGKPKSKTGKPPAPPEAVKTPPSAAKGSTTATTSTAPPAAPFVAPVAIAAAVPAAGTPSPALDPSPPTVVASSAQALRAKRRARTRVDGAVVAAASTLPAPRLLAPADPAGAAPGRIHRPAHAPTSSQHHGRAGRPTALVTTITRIVDVVPTPVRILIGALLALALALAVRSRLAALRARRLERQRGQLLEDVGLLQAALLPVAPDRLGPVGTSAAYRPAEGPGAGGDFYDVFALENGQLAVIVGDISGHGRQALPHTALVRFTLRAYLEAGLSPRVAVQTAGAVLEHQLGKSFATVVAATYDPRERMLVYACAGHPAPVIAEPQPGSQPLEPITAASAPPIGVGMRTGTRQTVVSVPGRSQACFYTDGVTEARVGADLFGFDRLARALAELGPAATATALLDRVAEQTDRRPDDMAACLLSVEGGADGAQVLVEELEFGNDEGAPERAEQFLTACGVQRSEVAELMRSAIRAVGRGAAVLEVHLGDGAPEVVLQRDNVTHLGPRLDRSHAGMRLSR